MINGHAEDVYTSEVGHLRIWDVYEMYLFVIWLIEGKEQQLFVNCW